MSTVEAMEPSSAGTKSCMNDKSEPECADASLAAQSLLPAGFQGWAGAADLSWMDDAPSSLNALMHTIAVAVLSSASATAEAVVTAAGPEYLGKLQKLAQNEESLRFLLMPLCKVPSVASEVCISFTSTFTHYYSTLLLNLYVICTGTYVLVKYDNLYSSG